MNISKRITLILTAACLLAACQKEPPASLPITEENYNDIEVSLQADILPSMEIKWSPDSQSILAKSDDEVMLLDAWTLKANEDFAFDDSGDGEISPDGKILAVPSGKDSIDIVETETDILEVSISPGYLINNIDLSQDGKMLLTSSYDDLRADVWEIESGKLLTSLTGFDTAAPVYRASFAKHSQHVIWHSRGQLQISDIKTGFLSMEFRHQDWVTSWALSSDGKKLATSAAGDVQGHFVPLILIWDTSSGDSRMLMNSDVPYERLAFCPNTHIIAIAEAGTITLIDLDTFSKPKEMPLGDSTADLAFSPDGSALAGITTEGKLVIWRVAQ